MSTPRAYDFIKALKRLHFVFDLKVAHNLYCHNISVPSQNRIDRVMAPIISKIYHFDFCSHIETSFMDLFDINLQKILTSIDL